MKYGQAKAVAKANAAWVIWKSDCMINQLRLNSLLFVFGLLAIVTMAELGYAEAKDLDPVQISGTNDASISLPPPARRKPGRISRDADGNIVLTERVKRDFRICPPDRRRSSCEFYDLSRAPR